MTTFPLLSPLCDHHRYLTTSENKSLVHGYIHSSRSKILDIKNDDWKLPIPSIRIKWCVSQSNELTSNIAFLVRGRVCYFLFSFDHYLFSEWPLFIPLYIYKCLGGDSVLGEWVTEVKHEKKKKDIFILCYCYVSSARNLVFFIADLAPKKKKKKRFWYSKEENIQGRDFLRGTSAQQQLQSAPL